jgi:tetratricopeptide (TPR) repeat protein
MLYYLSLEEGLSYMRPAPLPQREARGQVERVKAVAPEQRSAADWLTLAENGADVERVETVADALTRARALGLTPEQEARALLVEAGRAARLKHFPQALALYEQALPHLAGRQREVARYGIFITRTLISPDAAETLPMPELDPAEPASYVGQAFLAAYLGDFDRARALVAEGLARHPRESGLYLVKGGIGILTGDEKLMEEASREALAVDPDDPFALGLRSEIERHYQGNPDASIETARRAAALAPAGGDYWNQIAQGMIERNHIREAEQAIHEGLRQDPTSLVLRTNYAITLLTNHGRLEDAKAQIDIAESLDPDNAAVSHVRGLYHLMQGDRALALESALAASAANPSYGEALLVLAAIYYQNREYDLAAQQIDAAQRADPNSPYIPVFRAAVALDQYRADDAIVAAREALERYRARGGIYANLSESQGTGSYVTGAFRFLGLEDWGRYIADRTFDPFVSTSLFDRALSQVPAPYYTGQSLQPFDPQSAGSEAGLSDIFQGLRLDPLAVAGPERELHLFRQRFVEGILAPGLIATGGDISFSGGAQVAGTDYYPFPLSYSLSVGSSRFEGPVGANNGTATDNVTFFAGLQPTAFDKVVLYASWDKGEIEFPGTLDMPRNNGATATKSFSGLLFYAHEFGRENVLTVGGGALQVDRRLERQDVAPLGGTPLLFDVQYSEEFDSQTLLGYVNYAVGLGPVDLSVGLDYLDNQTPQRYQIIVSHPQLGSETNIVDARTAAKQYRAYVDARYVPFDGLEVQAQIARARTSLDGEGDSRIDWAVGAAWEPTPGQWLRAGYANRSELDVPVTLAPTAFAGLRPAEAPAFGSTESFIGRWDAEWSPHFFTAVEYQHQAFDGLSFTRPNFIQPITDILVDVDLIGMRPINAGRSKLDRVTASANLWLTGNVGVNALYAYSDSEVKEGELAGGTIPFLSRHYARAGVTWTHPSLVKVNAFAAYYGPRRNGVNAERDQSISANAELEWQSPDRRFQLNAGLYNLFDDDVELTPGVPNYGRTFTASVRVRF